MTESTQLDDESAFRTMSEEQIEDWKRRALSRPDSFAYWGKGDGMFETWSLGPVIQSRDSKILEEANARSIKATLESDPSLEGEWKITQCNHWAHGWVDHLSFRVVDSDGNITRVARVIKGLFDSLAEYPVLDDSLLSEMELDATMKNIRDHWNHNRLRDDVPDDWAGRMWQWWWDNDQGAIEDTDGNGGYPSDKEFEECARALGFWDTSEDE